MKAIDVTDLGLVLSEVADVHHELGEQLLMMKKQKQKNTSAYRMKKYQYSQLGMSIQALQNAYMCLPQDFKGAAIAAAESE